MSSLLSLENVVNVIESAFTPLVCVVEVFDFRQRIRFKVFDLDDRPVLTMEDDIVKEIRKPDRLRYIIDACRAKVESKGFRLLPWSLPTQEIQRLQRSGQSRGSECFA